MKTILLWFRRDLRLHDHPALAAAVREAERVVPVYIHAPDEEGTWAPGAASRWWLHHSLMSLDADLREQGAGLAIRQGGSLATLRQLIRETGAEGVYWSRLYEPAIAERDRKVAEALEEDGIEVHTFNAALLAEPQELATKAGTPFKVYTPFWRQLAGRLDEQTPVAMPRSLKLHVAQGEPLESLELLPKIHWDGGIAKEWTPGEAGAAQRLSRFLKRVPAYTVGRDHPAEEATSKLSPHLHFGEISPRQAVQRLRQTVARGGETGLVSNAEKFEKELAWREFAHHLLHHFPHTPEAPLNERFKHFPWRPRRQYAADLARWQRGQTGVPLVDAGMRQLWHTGWMHNRVRMIVASYLVKNLLIPWQEGERWFWDTLVDADLANNTLGWQWVAGCGADAAPYFRVFNPVTQATKFDAKSVYIRHWVPEAGTREYASPLVDLGESRHAALSAFAKMRSAAE